MPLTKTDWPLGWLPSNDPIGGDPNGLLRMDNLQQELDGSLTLVRGIQKFGAELPGFVEKLYPKNFDGVQAIYASTQDGGSICKSTNYGGFAVLFNGTDHAAFGDALGEVLITAGNVKKKEKNGIVNNLGIAPPTDPPTIGNISQPQLDIGLNQSWAVVEGHDPTDEGESLLLYTDATTLRASMERLFGTQDTTHIDQVGTYNLDLDTFYFLIQLRDDSLFTNIRVEILLDGDDHQNYYWYEWDVAGSTQINHGDRVQSILSVQRGFFNRAGDDSTLSWKTVNGIRITAEAIGDTWILAGEPRFVGGALGQLIGFYKYVALAVRNNGTYLAKSAIGPESETVYIKNGFATITPGTSPDPQVTEYWIFRTSVIQQVNTPLVQSKLDQYYRVGVTSGAGSIEDHISDVDLIEENFTLNKFLQSVQDIPDSILDMEGLYNERMIYMTFKDIYLSDRLNPDAIDIRYTIRAFGDNVEKNLWLKKINNNTLILATTKDLYEISGTLLDLPDGTLDVNIRAIGESYPPLSGNVCSHEGALYYCARDGWRVTTGSNSISISPQLANLFRDVDSSGVPPVAVYPSGVQVYPVAIGRNKLYASAPMKDGSRRLFVFDFVKKNWRLQYTDPIAICAAQDGNIIVGYGGGSGNFVRKLENGTGVDGIGGFPITLLTVFDNNGQPRNRKDTFTLKLVIDTGGKGTTVYLAKDGSSFNLVGSAVSSGLSTLYFDINSFTLGFRYALKIVDSNGDLTTFKLNEYTIEYEARPEQNTYMRIPNTNLGTQSRKRFVNYAFVIDTLGNNVNFTPYIDNIGNTPSVVNKATKLTNIHYFTSEKIGTDIGGILQSPSDQPFEFYGLNLEEIVSEKLPTPVEYLVIPSNDYGSPHRKRHTSYKFQILTRGSDVQFTPRVDGTNYTSATFNTTEKRTVEYYFDTSLDVKGIDIGGILQSLASTPFEFYGTIIPEKVELLPDRLQSFYIPFDNMGVAARKRVRTLPIIIDTGGFDVIFTPIVDGVSYATTVLNSSRKQTLYHYFATDIFGTDFGGSLTGTSPFEFYSFGNPEDVEVLPVPKRFDQFQPLRWDKIGKLFAIRTRLIMTGSTTVLPFKIYGDESPTITANSNELFSDNITVVPNTDNVYQYNFRKNINGTIMRLVIGPTADPFHRYDLQAKVAVSGMESDSRWVPLR